MYFDKDVCSLNSTSDYSDICLLEDEVVVNPIDEGAHTVPCYAVKNFNKTDFTSVIIMNTTQLVKHLSIHQAGMCSVVLFYASWCPFSIQMALWYNMLGRLVSGLPVIAVKIESQVAGFSASYLRYGVASVPSLSIFQGHKVVGRYNESDQNIQQLINFVGQFMDLSHYNIPNCCSNSTLPNDCCTLNFNATSDDHLGPIPVILEKGNNYLFIFSCAFLFFLVYFRLKG